MNYNWTNNAYWQVWLIPLADETLGVQVKLCYTLTMRAILERLRDASCGGAIQIDYLYLYYINTFLIRKSFTTKRNKTVDNTSVMTSRGRS